MKDILSEDPVICRITFFCFILLLLAVPIVFTVHSGNPFQITKNDALKCISGIFLILTSFLLLYKFKSKKLINKSIILERSFDPYITLFFITAAISTIFSVNPALSYYGYYTRPLGFEIYLYIFLVYIFSSFVLQDKNRIQNVLTAMEICAVLISLYAILQYTGNDPLNIQPPGNRRSFGTLGNGVFLGGYLIIVFPFSLIRIIKIKKLNISALPTLIILGAIIISLTRTAYVAVIVETAVTILLYQFVINVKNDKLKKRLMFPIYVVGGIAILLFLFALLQKENVFVERFISIASIFQNPRWLLWRDSLKIFVEYPITGCGVSAFPIIFENFYSIEFKLYDLYNYYDSAHSNFIQVLCTMGILGIVSYLLLLGHTIYIILRSIFSKTLKPGQKITYIGFLSMIIGYIIYGIADFDEVTILFYFFICLSLLKSIYIMDNKLGVYYIQSETKTAIKKGIIPLFIIMFLFISYNFYISYQHIRADKYYEKAYLLTSQNKFRESLKYFDSALKLWENNSYYHYLYAGSLLVYASSDTSLNANAKYSLLGKAKSEFIIARENYPSRIECNSFICLTDYEMGDTIEAGNIKNRLLGRDSLMIAFRISLAQFYVKIKEYNNAMEQLLFLCHYDTENGMFLATINSLLQDKSFPDPLIFCKKILSINPENEAANRFINSKH
jgi:O-antigen ligase